jgi:hypothetical protein
VGWPRHGRVGQFPKRLRTNSQVRLTFLYRGEHSELDVRPAFIPIATHLLCGKLNCGDTLTFNCMLPSTLKRIVLDGRVAVQEWTAYKHRTGRLPWLSLLVHFLNWIVVISGLVLLLWFSEIYHWSRWRFAVAAILIGSLYTIFWSWLAAKVRLSQVREGRRLARMKTPG